MKLDFKELERGIQDELEKKAFLPLLAGAATAAAAAPLIVPQVTSKIAPETHKKWSEDPNNLLYGAGTAVNTGLKTAGGLISGFNKLVNAAPKIIDTIGTYAPLAMGAMLLPNLAGGSQGGVGQPVVVNNYMGQRPNALNPQSGVNTLQESFGKAGEALDKKAEGVAEALVSAAKRRMANKVLDTVATPEKHPEEKSQEELEIVTKYPEMAKLLENEQNRAYLNRLLAH